MRRTKLTWYQKQLQHPNWQRKRLEILSRDGWKCGFCGDTESNLQVHHYEYERGKRPWEYSNDNFKTLCEACHEMCTTDANKSWLKKFIMDRHAFGTLNDEAVTYYFGIHLLRAA